MIWTKSICHPLQVQEKAKCIIGKDYPAPIVDHKAASQRNCRNMEELQKLLLARCNMEPEHVKPSDATEVKKFETNYVMDLQLVKGTPMVFLDFCQNFFNMVEGRVQMQQLKL